MKTILLLALAAPAFSDGIDSVTFRDLTGKLYKGPTADLELFRVKGMRTRCSDDYGDTEGHKILSWRLEEEHFDARRLQGFKIHFRAFDRAGKQLVEKTFKYDRNVAQGEGYVDKMECEERNQPKNHAVFLPVKEIRYGTVEYWVTDVVIEKPKKAKSTPVEEPRRAFTLKEQLEKAKEAMKPRN